MNDKNLHIENLETESAEFFRAGEIGWAKSKEQVWAEMMATRTTQKSTKTIRFKSQRIWLGFAATFTLLAGLAAFLYFYSATEICPEGQHLSAVLPDGSSVELNAGSSLKYFPIRWIISREVFFEGEGFFEVAKGRKFEVKSKYAKTSVLGTTFNIYSRSGYYKVSCIEGKVRVTAKNNESAILAAGQHIEVKQGEGIKKLADLKTEDVVSWRNNQFRFTATPFKEVAKEIERQYGISIQVDGSMEDILTCNFTKLQNVEEVLGLVCKPLGYKFVKQNEKNYLVVRRN